MEVKVSQIYIQREGGVTPINLSNKVKIFLSDSTFEGIVDYLDGACIGIDSIPDRVIPFRYINDIQKI